MQKKYTILIDLDGVLNEYNGNYQSDYIPPILDGAKEFLEKISQKFEIKLFTTRNRLLASKWLIKYKIDRYISDVTNIKEPALYYIDDRGIKFNGNFDDLYEEISNFEVWYK